MIIFKQQKLQVDHIYDVLSKEVSCSRECWTKLLRSDRPFLPHVSRSLSFGHRSMAIWNMQFLVVRFSPQTNDFTWIFLKKSAAKKHLNGSSNRSKHAQTACTKTAFPSKHWPVEPSARHGSDLAHGKKKDQLAQLASSNLFLKWALWLEKGHVKKTRVGF